MSVSTASSEAQVRMRDGGVAGLDSSRLVESDIASAAARVRGAENINPGADRMAKALARAFGLWRDRRLRAPARSDRRNRALGGVFRRDPRKLDRRAAETIHKRCVEGSGRAGFGERRDRQAKNGRIHRRRQRCRRRDA